MDKTYTTDQPTITLKGLALVILVHALILWGLSSGLAQQARKLLPQATDVKVIDAPPPPPPPPVVKMPEVRFDPLPSVVIPMPVIDVAPPPEAPRISASTDLTPSRDGPSNPAGTSGAGHRDHGAPQAGTAPTIVSAASVCSRMSKPEAPAVAWQGVANFKIRAQLAAGRVVGVQFLSSSAGMDGKTRRLLQRSIESTVMEGYTCQGDGSFEQEFMFRIED